MRAAPASRRGVLGGAVLIAVGLPFLLQAIGVPSASAYLFFALGLAFGLAWYLGTRQYVYLVPAAALISFGLGLLVPTWFAISNDLAAPIFLGALAAGFFIVFVSTPTRPAPLIPAVLLAITALLTLYGRGDLMPTWFQPMFVPLLFIALGVYLLVEKRTN
ncbi:MAG: SoxR reducing system RseC family protein [Chloroflexota bacterium]|nr:SoxR reducing system RseC family protein [Chloroflexota bacterium]